MKKILLFFILFGVSIPAFAQNLEREVNSLEQDFKSFEYKKVLQKGRFLLADTYTSHSDSLVIFQYMLSSAYALNDTTQAKSIILEILQDQPDFSLNPRETSPKIVEFFNLIKKDHIGSPRQNPPRPAKPIESKIQKEVPAFILAGSVLLPGSAHYFQGMQTKGISFSAVSAVVISSAVYFTFKTSSDREKYMRARNDASYDKLYNTYNSSYKMRTLSFAAWGFWSLYCLYDFQQSNIVQPVYDNNNQALSLQFQYRW